MKKKTYLIIIMALVLVFSVGCKDEVGKLEELEKEESKDSSKDNIKEEKIEDKGEIYMGLEQLELPKEGEKIGVIKTNYGEIKVRLFGDIAPKTVENFITLSNDEYYNGIIFHRVMNEFMIQGGDPTASGRGGESIWGKSFEDEFHESYHNFRGSLSMANSGPNTNGSQFFIVQKTQVDDDFISQMESIGEEGGFPEDVVKAYKELGGTPWLDYKHSVFGHVFEGMDVVDAIASLQVDSQGKPAEPVIIETIEIIEYQ